MKSTAPFFIARTALCTSPWPVIMMTGIQNVALPQNSLQLQSIQARHFDVEQQTTG